VGRVDDRMTEAELSFEERNHLYTLCITSFLVVSFVFLAFMLLLMQAEFLQTGWGFLIWFGLPYSILGPTTGFLAYEVFYPIRVRKTRMFHMKRFARRALTGFAAMLSFFTVTSISEITFSKTLGDNAFFPGIALYLLAIMTAFFLWLRRQNSREESSL
jgi:uncharacterized membrane protein